MYHKKLNGKKALVTGAGQGIGFQIAKDLSDAGCEVLVQYFNSEDGAIELMSYGKNNEHRVHIFKADLTQEAEVKALAENAEKLFGNLDILVNNAGGLIARRSVEATDNAYWERVMAVNVNSTMMLTRELIPLLSKSGKASIVNMSSLAGRKGGHSGALAYATSKGAIITWTRALAVELADRGIRVNSVAPGLILGTAFHATHSTKEAIDQTIASIPLKRAGTSDDVSRAVLFLASEYDGFITGATIDINGGVYVA
ncbi:MAG: SDR family oxidoreductase [Cyclobacteriaceae bacterium]|nr:SDR family oxidoreductase [Cyclobacteriaceae bacterium]